MNIHRIILTQSGQARPPKGGDHIQNPTKPDKTGQPLQMRGPTHAKPDNSRQSLQMDPGFAAALPPLVRSLVTNNAPFTRKIPFVTAPSSASPLILGGTAPSRAVFVLPDFRYNCVP